MGKGHRTTDLDKARDELMSHMVRCDVLEAAMEHRLEWLDDTMDFMAERWPSLSELQLAQLEMMGRQYLRPVIQHGSGNTAMNRRKGPTVEEKRAELDAAEATAAPDDTTALSEDAEARAA